MILARAQDRSAFFTYLRVFLVYICSVTSNFYPGVIFSKALADTAEGEIRQKNDARDLVLCGRLSTSALLDTSETECIVELEKILNEIAGISIGISEDSEIETLGFSESLQLQKKAKELQQILGRKNERIYFLLQRIDRQISQLTKWSSKFKQSTQFSKVSKPRFSLQIENHISQGDHLEFQLNLSTQSSLKEIDSSIEMPPDEIDIFGISQLWIKYKQIEFFSFKIGTFPTQNLLLQEMNWPFWSLEGEVAPIVSEKIKLDFSFRHDTLGLYIPGQTNAYSNKVERNVGQVRFKLKIAQTEFSTTLSEQWFSSGNFGVNKLSLGKWDYFDTKFAQNNLRYKILVAGTLLRRTFIENLDNNPNSSYLELSANFWKNKQAVRKSEGTSFSLKAKKFDTSVSAIYLKSECFAAPPILIPQDSFFFSLGGSSFSTKLQQDIPISNAFSAFGKLSGNWHKSENCTEGKTTFNTKTQFIGAGEIGLQLVFDGTLFSPRAFSDKLL